MKVFLTGATGYIGSVIAEKLQAAGHHVLGLARSNEAAAKLYQHGIEPHLGDLRDPETLAQGAQQAHAVIHAGFIHDSFDQFTAAVATEQTAVSAMLNSIAGSGKPFIYTSGTGIIGDTGTKAVDEDAPLNTPPFLSWRPEIERRVLESDRGIVLRPGLVYGRAGSGVLVGLILQAQQQGCTHYIDDGLNIWSTVHVDDLGEAYVLALEKAPPRTLLNIGGGEVRLREMSEAIGRLIGVPDKTRSLPLDEARKVIPFADGIATNERVNSWRVRQVLGWQPKATETSNILDEIEHGSYRQLLVG